MTSDASQHVLHVIDGLEMGGGEQVLISLVGQLQAAGWRNTVLSLVQPGPAAARLEASGAHVEGLSFRRGRLSVLGLHRLAGAIRRHHPTVLQGWMHHGNLAATVGKALARSRAPLFWSVHNTIGPRSEPRLHTRAAVRLGAALSGRAAAIVYVSAVSARQHEALGFRSDRTAVIPNGINCDLFRPDATARAALRQSLGVPPDCFVIGLFARWAPMKDHVNLLRAAKLLRDRGQRLHIVLAGTGIDPRNHALMRSTGELDLSANVTLLGERDDVPALMPGLDLFVLPSRWGEACPLVLGEAMAAGVPCVATDIGDSGLIVDDPARVVPPADSAALADAIAGVIQMKPALREQVSCQCRSLMLRRFSLSGMSEKYKCLYMLSIPQVRS